MEETIDKPLTTLSNIFDSFELYCFLCLGFLILQHKFDHKHILLRSDRKLLWWKSQKDFSCYKLKKILNGPNVH